MNCDLELLSAYLDGELVGDDKQAVAEHVLSCPQCRNVLSSYRAISAELKTLPVFHTSGAFDTGLFARLDNVGSLLGNPIGFGGWLQGIAGIAAVTILAFSMSFLLRGHLQGDLSAPATSVPIIQPANSLENAPLPMATGTSVVYQPSTAAAQLPALQMDAPSAASADARSKPAERTDSEAALKGGSSPPAAKVLTPAEAQSGPTLPPSVSRKSADVAKAGPVAQAIPTLAPARLAGPVDPTPTAVPLVALTQPTPQVPRAVASLSPSDSSSPASESKTNPSTSPTALADTGSGDGGRAAAAAVDDRTPLPALSGVDPVPPVTVTLAVDGDFTTTALLHPVTGTVPLGPPPQPARATSPQPSDAAQPVATPAVACVDASLLSSDLTVQLGTAVRQRLGCAIDTGRPVTVTEQGFEGGSMLKRADGSHFYVLGVDPALWYRYDDTARDGEHVEAATAVASDLLPPAREFASLWRDQPEVRDIVGSAATADRTFGGVVAQFQHGTVLWRDPHSIYVLYADGTWQTVLDRAEPPETPTPQGR